MPCLCCYVHFPLKERAFLHISIPNSLSSPSAQVFSLSVASFLLLSTRQVCPNVNKNPRLLAIFLALLAVEAWLLPRMGMADTNPPALLAYPSAIKMPRTKNGKF